jgi:hypothetical protein
VFSSQDPTHAGQLPGRQEGGRETLEELKNDLTRLLKHASNIRNLKADQWVILTVVGAGGWTTEAGIMGPYGAGVRSGMRLGGAGKYGTGSYGVYGGGGYGGYGGFGSSGGAGGGAGGAAGYGAIGGGGFGYGGMAGVAGMGTASSATLTMRVKKSDVDAFAKGEIDFEQFQQKVKILTY